jgi:hypothetical protein
VHGLRADQLPPPAPPPRGSRGRDAGARRSGWDPCATAAVRRSTSASSRSARAARPRAGLRLPRSHHPADRPHPGREGRPGRGLPPRDPGRQGLAQGPDREVRP